MFCKAVLEYMTDLKLTGTDIGTIVVVLYYLESVARDLVQAPQLHHPTHKLFRSAILLCKSPRLLANVDVHYHPAEAQALVT